MNTKHFMRFILLGGTALLVGCASLFAERHLSEKTNIPVLTQTVSTTSFQNSGDHPTPTYSLSVMPHQEHIIRRTPTVLSDNTIHSVIRETLVSQLTLDERFLYWTRHNDEKLYRISLNGGRREVLATSHYDHGQFSVMPFVRTGRWLIVMDTPIGREEGRTWQIRAIDLKNHTEHILMESKYDPASWPGPEIRGDGYHRIVVTYNHTSSEEQCTENTLEVIDLETNEVLKLDEGCAEERHMWVFAGISGSHVVADRYLPENKGGTSDIFLFNINSGKVEQLTNNGQSSMPDISGKWIVWKASPRFTFGQTVLYDIETNKRFLMDLPDIPGLPGYRAPKLANGRWLYWRVTKSGEPVFGHGSFAVRPA